MTDLYKIFAYKDGKYWCGHKLLTFSQIRNTLDALKWKREVFTTIQNYDEFGNCISCPLYFDFDGPPAQVHKDVMTFVQIMEYNLNITPKIFFSGNKGFHLIVDYILTHPQCHLLVQHFAKEICSLPTLDHKVYRTNAMWRIPNSPASAPGFYKIPLTRKELFTLPFNEIKALATKQRLIDEYHDIAKINESVMDDWLITAIASLPKYNDIGDFIAYSTSVGMEMTPCVYKILTTPQPSGQRHESVFILARFFKLCGLDLQSSTKIMLSFSHWKDYEDHEAEVSKVFKSVFYSAANPSLGCKNNSFSAEMMRQHCDHKCHFSENFPVMLITDSSGVTANV